ncbi:hypothetical protein GQ44DRAFT_194776 [Phaeosphaeriaceae sp. PMI808]|nr:hypothetical protein GQ44DRAFT_194776 [Phaeosphaeriaceae sp. PMI808]
MKEPFATMHVPIYLHQPPCAYLLDKLHFSQVNATKQKNEHPRVAHTVKCSMFNVVCGICFRCPQLQPPIGSAMLQKRPQHHQNAGHRTPSLLALAPLTFLSSPPSLSNRFLQPALNPLQTRHLVQPSRCAQLFMVHVRLNKRSSLSIDLASTRTAFDAVPAECEALAS